MIELKNENLVFTFPEVHELASLRINFQRTLRIPDDDRDHALPPGLGTFPLRHVDDFAKSVSPDWLQRGGVMLPMYQAEAMWLLFEAGQVSQQGTYPFLIKIAAGKINAITGDPWADPPQVRPQDYVVAPKQPWLDGYCVEKGVIRQFVAMPLGAGYTAEEQITGKAEHGGLQILACPMKRAAFERRFPVQDEEIPGEMSLGAGSTKARFRIGPRSARGMGLAPGGRMRQEISDDPFDFNDWDFEQASRCFVHLANSMVWQQITGQRPPTTPPTARQYTRAGLPWFDYYSDGPALEGSKLLKSIKSVFNLGKEKGDVPLPENQSVDPTNVVRLRSGLKPGQVRETRF